MSRVTHNWDFVSVSYLQDQNEMQLRDMLHIFFTFVNAHEINSTNSSLWGFVKIFNLEI